jgi:hypothetical protein
MVEVHYSILIVLLLFSFMLTAYFMVKFGMNNLL